MSARACGILVALLTLLACGPGQDRLPVPGTDGALKSAAHIRAERRAYDGAPPVIPHNDFGMTCTQCHNLGGIEVPDVGFAPPYPHDGTLGLSGLARCRQCHVFAATDGTFVANSFVGLPQDLRRGRRLNPIAPPTIPHRIFMRENCLACHGGAAAREEIRTSHPERVRCRQCHVEVRTNLSLSLGG
jgi:cytochrome c-type protein NapB